MSMSIDRRVYVENRSQSGAPHAKSHWPTANRRTTRHTMRANLLRQRPLPRQPKHLVAIVDPLSAFLLGAATIEGRAPGGVCDRTLSIFDGLRRYDVKLEQQGTGTTVQKGLAGSTTVCRAVFQPVAGRIGEGNRARGASPSSGVDQITITFGRTSIMDLYIPISIQAQTRFGAASVLLTAFGVDPARSAASR